MSPFAAMWIAVDVAALALVAAVLATRYERTTLALRPLLTAQAVVVASAIAASTALEPLRSNAEWTLMVAVNLGYALACWRGGAAARLLGNTAIGFTTLAVVLITLRAFSSIIAIAIGLVFAWARCSLRCSSYGRRESRVTAKRVVIVGGGFGGLHLIRHLEKRLRRGEADVTLIDRSNYSLFTPLLYQVATGELPPHAVAYPLQSAACESGLPLPAHGGGGDRRREEDR